MQRSSPSTEWVSGRGEVESVRWRTEEELSDPHFWKLDGVRDEYGPPNGEIDFGELGTQLVDAYGQPKFSKISGKKDASTLKQFRIIYYDISIRE